MSDPGLPSEPWPTLQPLAPAGPQGPPTGPPVLPPGPARPQRPVKRRSTWLIVLLILAGLGLVASVTLNVLFLGDFSPALDYGAGMRKAVVQRGKSDQTIALYSVEGIIDDQAAGQFRLFYRAVAGDDDVKAIVLRVNSPGGGVTASDQICQMVKDLRSSGRKVVVSMGSLGASGAYYISAPADEIYAEATTITGSIGVVAGWVVLKGTLDKVGAEPIVIKSSHARGWKDEMSYFSRPADYQRKHIQGVLDKMQERFEDVVRAGRGTRRLKTQRKTYKIPPDKEGGQEIEHTETEPFNGKIYLAEEAKQLGLIDSIGYQDAAIRRAAQLAGLRRQRVVVYARRRSLMETLLENRTEPSFKLDGTLFDKLQTPRFLMLWKAD
jgi:protease-4